MLSDKIIALCPQEAITLDLPANLARQSSGAAGTDAPYSEDAVEEMVVCLAAIEAAWSAGEFQRLHRALGLMTELALAAGLKDVAFVAKTATELVSGCDEIALAAVIARLVRVGEASLATLLEISYRLI